ncbi:MAG: STAS domain-containing protein [Pirellulaceae bacterium]|nr:STAS domain-containing protein [Pirellulaceae bacterium]
MPSETAEDASYECPVCGARLTVEPPLPPHEAPCPVCAYPLWCRKRTVDDVVVLDVMRGRTPEHAEMQQVAEKLLGSKAPLRVVVDLSDLDFISSALMARLVALNKRIRAADGRFILCGMQPVVRDAFHDSTLHRVFEIHADQQASFAAL